MPPTRGSSRSPEANLEFEHELLLFEQRIRVKDLAAQREDYIRRSTGDLGIAKVAAPYCNSPSARSTIATK
jgi:hypothetical protein